MTELVFNPPDDFIPSPEKPAHLITDADVEAVFPDAALRRQFCNDYRKLALRQHLASLASAPASEWDGGAASKPAAVPIADHRPASSETGRVTRLHAQNTRFPASVDAAVRNGS